MSSDSVQEQKFSRGFWVELARDGCSAQEQKSEMQTWKLAMVGELSAARQIVDKPWKASSTPWGSTSTRSGESNSRASVRIGRGKVAKNVRSGRGDMQALIEFTGRSPTPSDGSFQIGQDECAVKARWRSSRGCGGGHYPSDCCEDHGSTSRRSCKGSHSTVPIRPPDTRRDGVRVTSHRRSLIWIPAPQFCRP